MVEDNEKMGATFSAITENIRVGTLHAMSLDRLHSLTTIQKDGK